MGTADIETNVALSAVSDMYANGKTQQVEITVSNPAMTSGENPVPNGTDKKMQVVVSCDKPGLAQNDAKKFDEGFTGSETFYINVNQAGKYTVQLQEYDSTWTTVKSVSFNVIDNASASNSWSKGHTAEYTQKADADGDYIFTETGSAVDFGVSKVYSMDGESVLTAGKDYEVRYYKNVSATASDSFDGATDTLEATAPKTAGHYWLTVWPTAEYANGAYQGVTAPIAVPFEITADATATEYCLYQVKSDKSDVSDTTFVYSGKDFIAGPTSSTDLVIDGIGLAVDGVAYSKGLMIPYDSNYTNIATDDLFVDTINGEIAYSCFTNAKGNNSGYWDGGITDAGTYKIGIAKKTATGKEVVAYVNLVVEAFDFSKAELISADIEKSKQNAADTSYTFAIGEDTLTVAGDALDTDGDRTNGAGTNGVAYLKAKSFTPAKNVTAVPGELPEFNKLGSYGVTFSAPKYDEDEAVNTTGSVDGTIRVVNSVASNFTYTLKGAAKDFSDHGTVASALVIDKSDKEAFDAEDISWTGKTGDVEDTAEVTIYDAEGNVVSDATATGTYKVVVSVNTGLQYLTGGSDYFYIRVVNGEGANVFFTFDGKPVSAGTETVPYTGSAYDYSVVVKTADEEKAVLKEGVDYTVEIKDTDLNKVVTEIKEFGNYSITVKPLGYEFTAQTLNIEVEKGTFEGVEVVEQTFGYDGDYKGFEDSDQVRGIAWTGEAVTPAVKAYNTKTVAGEEVRVYTDLTSDMYTVSYETAAGKKVAAADLKDEGDYKATITVTKAFDDKYDGFKPDTTVLAYASDEFSIVKTVGFTDVKASEWYADEAYKAKQLGYMTGLSGTSMLLPNADITRADVAMVLMRMAGGDPDLEKGESYPTKFADVEADAYYAKAIDWAYKAGIVTGYDGTSNFGPNDLVTREQLATMLGRFAENVMGEDVSAGEIDGYVDAGSVQEFAVEGMSWCVENGVFGVNTDVLDPQGNASRAQVAAIAVRVMPAVEK